MKIVFRTDASSQIGSGHVIRCLTLAKELRRLNVKCKFICRDHKNNLIKKIKNEDFDVVTLPSSKQKKQKQSTKTEDATYFSWLGNNWREDALQTIKAIKNEKIDWLIIDHYGIDDRWEKKLKSNTRKIMVIDDLSNRSHDCDLLLDQNLVANYKRRYQNLIPKYTTSLLGPQYALLQDEYKDMHLFSPPRIGLPKNILVYFGGSDQYNITEKVLHAFLKLNRDDINLDIVISSYNPFKERIKKLSRKNKNITINGDTDSLASLMLKADFSVGACGATSWERCCLGLPSLVVTIAENQRPIASELHKQRLIHWLGHHDTITNLSIHKALEIFVDQDHEAWSTSCKLVTNGRGAQKVASLLTINSKTKLKPRLVQLKDQDFLQNWSNLKSKSISSEKFTNSFYLCLRNHKYCKIYIIETNEGLPICQVRFSLINNRWNISYSQERFLKSFKLEKYFIESAINKFRNDQSGKIEFSGIEKNNKNSKKNKLLISVCSEKTSWINNSIPSLLYNWINQGHNCSWVHNAQHLLKGDICFYLSYEKIVTKKTLEKYKNNLVVHASNLPEGKGWSPLSWQILEGNNNINVTLIEAEEKVDSGDIYMQLSKKFNGYELLEELRSYIKDATLRLCSHFIDKYPECIKKGKTQTGKETFYPQRLPIDSKLDLNKSIKEQFDLLRIVDNDHYPAFFEIDGHKYYLLIKKDKF